jgi:hypothetical protein
MLNISKKSKPFVESASKCQNILRVLEKYNNDSKLEEFLKEKGKKAAAKTALLQTIKIIMGGGAKVAGKIAGKMAGPLFDLLWPTMLGDSTYEGYLLLELDAFYKWLESDSTDKQKGIDILNSLKETGKHMTENKYYGDSRECYEALKKLTNMLDKYMDVWQKPM